MYSAKSHRSIASIVIATMFLLVVPAAGAQTAKPTGTIGYQLAVSAPSLRGHTVMISALRDGRIVEQQEHRMGDGSTLRGDNLTEGLYDVRVEGEGIVTEEKHGVHVFGGREVDLIFDLRPGKGVHIVEYATGALSREEVATRLARLEAAVAEMAKARSPK